MDNIKNEQKSEIDLFIDKSKGTDKALLLTAKEELKRKVKDDPSPSNLAALERVSKMLENAVMEARNFPTWNEALIYLKDEMGRKVEKSKLFRDIKTGRLKKQADGSFKLSDLNRYAASLDLKVVPERKADKTIELAEIKMKEEIRRTKALADKEEFALQIKQGHFIPKDRLYLELAARALALSSALKTTIESSSLDLIHLIEGKPQKSNDFTQEMHKVIDDAMGEYAKEIELDVTFETEFQEDDDLQDDDITN